MPLNPDPSPQTLNLKSLQLTGFRCFKSLIHDDFGPMNLFIGPNGSGKTAVLEAIHLLSQSKSFRTDQRSAWVQQGALCCEVQGSFHRAEDGFDRTIRLKSVKGRLPIWLDDEDRSWPSMARLHYAPLQALGPESLQLLSEGPELRRKWMDWGCFYAFPDYGYLWRQHQRLLKQRNALLKASGDRSSISFCDELLVAATAALTERRACYLNQLIPYWQRHFKQILPQFNLSIAWKPGWDESEPYAATLVRQRPRDLLLGNTGSGAHRADFICSVEGVPLKQRLSRGELKLALLTLWISQAMWLKQERGVASLLLCDDLPAELDGEATEQAWSLFRNSGLQSFITTLTLPMDALATSSIHFYTLDSRDRTKRSTLSC